MIKEGLKDVLFILLYSFNSKLYLKMKNKRELQKVSLVRDKLLRYLFFQMILLPEMTTALDVSIKCETVPPCG